MKDRQKDRQTDRHRNKGKYEKEGRIHNSMWVGRGGDAVWMSFGRKFQQRVGWTDKQMDKLTN